MLLKVTMSVNVTPIMFSITCDGIKDKLSNRWENKENYRNSFHKGWYEQIKWRQQWHRTLSLQYGNKSILKTDMDMEIKLTATKPLQPKYAYIF